MKKFLIVSMMSLFLVSSSVAGGFELYEFGARASALGGATVARAWDASTVFYNPAGIAFLKGTNFYGGVTFITAKNIFTGAQPLPYAGETHESVDAIHHPIGVYFTHQFNEDLFAGIGVTNPFGLGIEWEEDFPGRAIAFNTDLKSFYISPVAAYKVTDELSISGGLDLVIGVVTLERAVYPFAEEGAPGIEVGKTKIEGTSNLAFGFTASAMYQTEKLGLGFMYRHSTENKLEDGDVSWEYYDTPMREFAQQNINFEKVDATLNFPNFLTAGIYYKFTENMGAEIDYQWFNWSVFKEIVFDFKNTDGSIASTQVVPEDYENSWLLRIGVHYDITPDLQLRVGYIRDETPQPVHSVSPLLPDNDRNDYSVGLGYTHDNMQFDIGYMMVDFGERSTVENGVGQNENGFDGTYSTLAHLLFVSFGINFN